MLVGGKRVGVIHGRFQPFHNDHLRYALEAFSRCDYLIVGITNPDRALSGMDDTDLHRSLSSANPFTFYERLLIVRETLLESGLDLSTFDIVPFPINKPELLKSYVPIEAIFFMTIYDDWGRKKAEVLRSQGLQVEVLWEAPLEAKAITATEIRRRITHNLPWSEYVPLACDRIVREMGLDRRLLDGSR
jgi:nicotinamide-nucleotide adenylyltransferase